MNFFTKIFLIIVIGIPTLVFSQTSTKDLEGIFFNKRYDSLEEAIRYTSKKQALYAYNISNLSTPGFKPVLTPEDMELLNKLVPNKEYSTEILLEFFMSRMTENSKRYTAYVTLWKGKVDNVKRIVTLGK